MDNHYKPLAIPQRNTDPKQVIEIKNHRPNASTVNFAEMEIVAAPIQRPQTTSQPIKPQPQDPIRDKFTAMRRIFMDKPYSRNDAELFYKQMKFMEDYEDDYAGNEEFSMYYPSYHYMGYEQLRTYFTWRSNVRRGQYTVTSLSYIFVYMYELLACIGTKTPACGLQRYLELWQALRTDVPVLDKYFLGWLKDYHIYYDLDFAQFVDKHNLATLYPQNYLFESTPKNCLDLWNAISGYNVNNSRFYQDNNQELMQSCFYTVIKAIEAFCISKDTSIQNVLMHVTYMSVPWQPFSQALFFSWYDQPDRKLSLPGGEVYYCKRNIWTADTVTHQSRRAEIASYIIRKTEECLRKTTKYKHEITAYTKAASRAFRGFTKTGITRQQLDAVIEKAVADYHNKTKRTIVTVKPGNLDRIREEAKGTQDMLVVPEANDAPSIVSTVAHKPAEHVKSKPQTNNNPWTNLKSALTPTEIKALSLLLDGTANLNDLGVMPEVLLDSINEKASDHIGDNILDEDFAIYDDYIAHVSQIICK